MSRLRTALRLALALSACSGCAYTFLPYQPISRPLTHGRTVQVVIDDQNAPFKYEGLWGAPAVKSTSLPLSTYLRAALEQEFRAGGFVVAEQGPYDVVVRVRPRDVIGAHVVGFWLYPLTIGYMRQAGIVDLSATVRLPATNRVFQRRFAQVAKGGTFWFFMPFNLSSSNSMVHRASQRCLAELVAAVAELLRNPNGQV